MNADWVQAIGSIVAIFAAAGIAIWQSHNDHRRSESLVLRGKLEQLYSSVTDARDRLGQVWELALPLRDTGTMSEKERRTFAANSKWPRIDRTIRMYAVLYFPRLQDGASRAFDSNRTFTKVWRAIAKGESVTFLDFQTAYLAYEFALDQTVTDVKNEMSHLSGRLGHRYSADTDPAMKDEGDGA